MSTRQKLLEALYIPESRIDEINSALFRPNTQVISDFLDVVEKYGTPEEINFKAQSARQLPVLLEHVRKIQPKYIQDLEWLTSQRDQGAFISIPEYRKKILGPRANKMTFKEDNAVTLEISACQYFPWLIDIAQQAIQNKDIMPGRFVRVRNMKEQEEDGDLPAFSAAMQIIGASYVEQLDTRGSDGSNIHLGGLDTIIGYYGGVGEPNSHALQWLDEYLYYYTNYGICQILNVNNGTALLGYFLYRLGIDIQFKISVTLGNDNPYSALWTLMTAKLFARQDGSTPLVGFNWSNSVDNETIEITAQFRKDLNLEKIVRFEHHVTETWKGLVIQPYNRREDILNLADHIPNISAKHEGGEPEIESTRARPSDVQDYYRAKEEIITSGEWEAITLNFKDKFDSLNLTARELTKRGLAFVAASNLHSPC
ncbi:MAG: hypothetical protein ABFD51_08355 [Anaerolineaceae bacterium]